MQRFSSKALIVLVFLLSVIGAHAVLDRFNVSVGFSGSNELAISTDTPGEFDYSLHLRTADNTPTSISVHYTGVNNFSRRIKLSCVSGEMSIADSAGAGSCVSGGPFVRGVFIAGNSDQFAAVKRFTLFCGTIQIVGDTSTDHWTSDFTSSDVTDFLNNGASSTWCPTPNPTASMTPTPTKKITPTRTPTPKIRLTPTPEIVDNEQSTQEDRVPTAVPTINAQSSLQGYVSAKENPFLQIAGFVMIILGTILVTYFNRNIFIRLWRRLRGETIDVPEFDPDADPDSDLEKRE